MRKITFGQYLELIDKENIAEKAEEIFGSSFEESLIYEFEMRVAEKINGKLKAVEDLHDLTFGQFIAIENILTNPNLSKKEIFKRLATLIIRPSTEDIYDNESREREERIENEVQSLHAKDVMEAIDTFLTARENFLKKQYNGVFYIEGDGEDDDEKDKKVSDAGYGKFLAQWYWYSLARDLAKENIVIVQNPKRTRFENALDTKMSLVAPELAYKRQIQIIREIEEKKQQMSSKI